MAEAKTAAAPEAGAKSIINPKYRDRYKTPDWLGETIAGVATSTREVERKVETKNEETGETETKTVTETKNDGVNVDALFKLARENGLDAKVEKFEAQRNLHGFPGRFRMTVRNMLQAVAKQRHGIVVGGKFVSAPGDWLDAKGAPERPTHKQDGTKIAIEKPKAGKTEGAGNSGDAPAKNKPKGK